MTHSNKLDRALLPYEKKLRTQERLRRLLGVKEVDRPTYEKYITGPIERFDRRRNAFATLAPDDPFGEGFRRRFKAITGHDHYREPLPYRELECEDRIGQSLAQACKRLCVEYHPVGLPVTPVEGRVDTMEKGSMTRLIKKIGLMLGADRVHITKVDPRWIYKDVEIPHQYAILLVVRHKPTLLGTAPSHFSWAAAGDAYARLKLMSTQLSDFICGIGYQAQYRETLGEHNPEMIMVPMAIDAGVGEFARTGRVLSPEYGINMRIKAVTTDLPLQVDKPISFGVHEFCMSCENCATFCPSNAVPFGGPTEEPPDPIFNNPGYKKWWVRADRCLTFWATNKKRWLSCGGRCIAVCPWNKPLVFRHNLVRWTAIHAPPHLKRLLAWADVKVYGHTKSIK